VVKAFQRDHQGQVVASLTYPHLIVSRYWLSDGAPHCPCRGVDERDLSFHFSPNRLNHRIEVYAAWIYDIADPWSMCASASGGRGDQNIEVVQHSLGSLTPEPNPAVQQTPVATPFVILPGASAGREKSKIRSEQFRSTAQFTAGEPGGD
jgi:hypothetical protein